MKRIVFAALVGASVVSAGAPVAAQVALSSAPLPSEPSFVKASRYEFVALDVLRGPTADGLSPRLTGPSIADDGTVLWLDFRPGAASALKSSDGGLPRTLFQEGPGTVTPFVRTPSISDRNGWVAFQAFDPGLARNAIFVAPPGGAPVRVTGPDVPAILNFESERQDQGPDDPPLPSNDSPVSCAGPCAISNDGRAGFLLDREPGSLSVGAVATAREGRFIITVPDDLIERAPVELIGGSVPVYLARRIVGSRPGSAPDTVEPIFIDQVNAQFGGIYGVGEARIGDWALDGSTVATVIRPLEGDTRPVLGVQNAQNPGTLIAETAGPLADLRAPSLNAAGTVVFEATWDVAPLGSPGVFDGGDPARRLVLGPGSRLFGEVVQEVSLLEGDALNEAGQIALSALTRASDGGFARYVLRADPAPGLRLEASGISALLHGPLGAPSLSQSFVAPGGSFDLAFDLLWQGGDGLLEVLFDGERLGAFGPDDSARWTLSGIEGPGDGSLSLLEFALRGGASLLLDDVTAEGLANGGFEDGGLAGWETEGGVFATATAFAPVPVPATALLLPAGLGALALARAMRGRRQRRR